MINGNSKYRRICLIVIFSVWGVINAQTTPQYEYTFNQDSLPAVIDQLEAGTAYEYFYLEEWLSDFNINGAISTNELDTLLDFISGQTSLNYYIIESEKRVFLFPNTYIRDALPASFFTKKKDTTAAVAVDPVRKVNPPVFLKEILADETRERELIRIGKSETSSNSQTYELKGIARFQQSREVIPGLLIEAGSALTTTDEQGRYSLELKPGYHEMRIKAMGVRETTKYIILYNHGELDLYLEEGVEKLEEVIVEGSSRERVTSAQSGKENIDSDRSKEVPLVLGERNILEIARSLPGISSAGEGATGLNVRGGKTDQNLVLLDKATIYNPTHFFGIFQALNPFTTQGVEIYKGALPVEYGGRLSSVFDITTKNGNKQQIAAEGSLGPVTANLALEIPVVKDTSSLIIGGRGAYADWVLRALDDPSLSNSEASFFDAILKYNHQWNSTNNLSASAYYSRDAFSITSDSIYQYNNQLASVEWNHSISDATQGLLGISYSGYDFNIRFDGGSNNDFQVGYGIEEFAAHYRLQRNLKNNQLLKYGLENKFYSVSPGTKKPLNNNSVVTTRTIDRERGIEGALFTGYQFSLTEKLLFDLGLRYSYFAALGKSSQRRYQPNSAKNETTVRDTVNYDNGEIIKFYGGPELRISFRYLLNPDLSIKGSLSNARQFIHTLSNNTTVSPIDIWKLSDLHIKPQQSLQGTLGVFKNFGSDSYELSLEGYYKKLQDVLDFKTGAELFLNENVETEVLQGDGKAYGIEFLLRKKQGSLSGLISYTYSRSLNRFDGITEEERINGGNYFPSNYDKPHDVSAQLNYRFTRRYSVSANMVYQTGRPVTYPIGTYRYNNSEYVAFSQRNEYRIPDYYRLDLGLNIEGNHKKNKLAHSFVTLSVYNVLGRNNPYSVYFINDQGQVKALQSSIFGIPVPSVTYNFKF